MNISIDLLPQQRKNSVTRYPMLVGAAAVLLAVTTFAVSFYFIQRSQVASLESEIAQETTTRDQYMSEIQTRRTGITEYNVVDQYKTLHTFLTTTYRNSVVLKENLYKLLPPGSSVTSYTYEVTGSVTMTVLFATKEDAASYLRALLEADGVNEAIVTSLALNEEKGQFEGLFELQVDTLEGEDK